MVGQRSRRETGRWGLGVNSSQWTREFESAAGTSQSTFDLRTYDKTNGAFQRVSFSRDRRRLNIIINVYRSLTFARFIRELVQRLGETRSYVSHVLSLFLIVALSTMRVEFDARYEQVDTVSKFGAFSIELLFKCSGAKCFVSRSVIFY